VSQRAPDDIDGGSGRVVNVWRSPHRQTAIARERPVWLGIMNDAADFNEPASRGGGKMSADRSRSQISFADVVALVPGVLVVNDRCGALFGVILGWGKDSRRARSNGYESPTSPTGLSFGINIDELARFIHPKTIRELSILGRPARSACEHGSI
jgi:hypothetical protein